MPSEGQEVSLTTLRGGGAVEQFDYELRKVLANVLDPNTDPKAARKITLEVVVKPSEDRRRADVQLKIGSKLATMKRLDTMIFLGERDGKPVAVTYDPGQLDMIEEHDPDIRPFTRKEG